jgi:hypothetical protein
MFHLKSDLAGIFGNIASEKLSIEAIATPIAADLHATTIANPHVQAIDRVCCAPVAAVVGI